MQAKTQRFTFLFIMVVALLALTTGLTLAKDGSLDLLTPQATLSTGFTYQGQLTDGGSPAEGSFDFQFELYDAETDGSLIGTVALEDVTVTDGLFTVSLDFGSGVFDGQARWLAISVRPGDETGTYTPLNPRQPLTAAPYAQYALEAGSVAWEDVTQNPIPGSCAAGEILAWNETLATWECIADSDTTYSAGFGLGLDGTTFNVLTNTVQTRVTDTCSPGSMVTAVNADGTVVCETDDDTTYTAGFGLGLDGTTFNVLSNTVQTRVTGTCAPGSMVRVINADGTVVCGTVSGTPIDAGFGLELIGTTLNVLTNTIQTRVTGNCAVGSTIRAIHADGSVECQMDAPLNRPLAPMKNISATLDAAGDVGAYASITVGTDGLLIVSYKDIANDDLKVVHCNNIACNSFNTTTLDAPFNVGAYTAITIGADGLPIISYSDATNFDLKVAHCHNTVCSSATLTSIDTVGDVGYFTSITIGADGLPVISYWDDTNNDLKVAHCNDFACSSATLTSVDTAGNVGRFGSITTGADGLPVISYYDDTNNDLKVAHCNDFPCSTATLTPIDTGGNVGQDTSITIGFDGLPVISYWDTTNNNLKVAHCNDMVCSTATLTTVDSTGNVGRDTSITIGADGLPIISYRDNTTANLKVAHCSDPVCSSTTFIAVDTSGSVGQQLTSITIGADGLPVISYYDETNTALKVMYCSNPFCAPYFRRR